jgi:hypothetical protein
VWLCMCLSSGTATCLLLLIGAEPHSSRPLLAKEIRTEGLGLTAA